MTKNNKIKCLHCLRRKERITEIERDFLMLEAWIKHLRSDVTLIVEMKSKLEDKIRKVKEEWETEFIGCIEQ